MMKFPHATRVLLAASMILLVVAIGGHLMQCVVQEISVVRHAYMADRACSCAVDAVARYVGERGKWPTSWNDLESICETGSVDFLPQGGFGEIKTYVEINFSLTLGDVANQRVEDFNAIKPIAPARDSYRRHLIPLLETVRTMRTAERTLKPERSNIDIETDGRTNSEK
jgi:hypothetical protein